MTDRLPTPYYDRDGITIYHGDCREILPLLEPGSIDLVLTDPPYGVSERTKRATNGRGGQNGKNWPSRDWPEVEGDNEPFDPEPLLKFKRVVLFGANHYASRLPSSPSWIVWDKRDGIPSNDNADAELIWTNCGGPARIYRHMWSGLIRATEVGQKPVHPTQKPVALMSWIIDKFTNPGDTVIDPYMGSGPVAKACHVAGRKYVGVEMHLPYVEEAVKRLQQQVLPLEVDV